MAEPLLLQLDQGIRLRKARETTVSRLGRSRVGLPLDAHTVVAARGCVAQFGF